MRILVVSQRYWPESFQVTDVCEELVERGHEVTVLTGLPNVGIPGERPGIVLDRYRKGSNRIEEHNGVHIVRVFEVGRRTDVLHRFANYYSFWKAASVKVLSMDRHFDVVFAYQMSPGMMAVPAAVYKSRNDVPMLIYCCDLWPESLKVGIGDRFPFVLAHYGNVCGKAYRKADAIAIQSPCFKDYFVSEHRVDTSRLTYVPQFSTDECGEPVWMPHEGINLFFMGNMGKASQIPLILEAFAGTSRGELRLHFVGDGSMLAWAKSFVKNRGIEDRVVFHGRVAPEELKAYYEVADACVLALGDGPVGLTIPSKLQGYMGAGKPVVASIEGGGKVVIEQSGCGLVVPVNDVEAFSSAMESVCDERAKWREMGRSGRLYFQKYFSKKVHVDAIEGLLEQLLKEKR